MPNPNTLDWIHYQDIQVPDITLQKQLQQYFKEGQYEQVLSILTNNETQLQGKAFVANVLNVITAGVSTLESNYYDNVPLFLSNLSNQYSVLINNFINKKNWNSSIQYTLFNFVVYNNEVYLCISQPPVGTVPTNTNYWLYLGLQGEQGVPGIGVNMRYTWNDSDTYNINDIVVYERNIYIALAENTNVVPGTDSSVWGIFLTSTPGQINVGVNPPDKFIDNTVWFQTQIDPLSQTTTTPIIGQFYRYNMQTNDWEEMYPNILFRWLDGYENYAPIAKKLNLTIQPSQWQNKQFIYNYPTISENSLIQIYPGVGINSNQYAIYNTLSVSINNKNIIISTSSNNITIDIPIIIKIQ